MRTHGPQQLERTRISLLAPIQQPSFNPHKVGRHSIFTQALTVQLEQTHNYKALGLVCKRQYSNHLSFPTKWGSIPFSQLEQTHKN
ncbi:hypothetical protein EE612_037259 [Oryza sativa]|nr:hypothetical protein EE612_037259 [Oryza sativa]